MTDPILNRLNRGLEVCLFDQLRIIADRLAETGQQELANAYLVLADNRMVPMRFADRWHWRENRPEMLPLSHQLPGTVTLVLALLPERIGFACNESGSMAEAYRRAAEAMVLTLRIDVQVESRLRHVQKSTSSAIFMKLELDEPPAVDQFLFENEDLPF